MLPDVNTAGVMSWRAEAMGTVGCWEESAEEASRALLRDPAWVPARRVRMSALKALGRSAERLTELEEIQRVDPRDEGACRERVDLLSDLDRYGDALLVLEEYCGDTSSRELKSWAGNMRGLLLTYIGRFDEAKDAFEDVLRADPDDYSTLYNLAVVKTKIYGDEVAKPDLDKARAALTQLAGNSKTRRASEYGLAGLAAVLGSKDEALEGLARALRLGGPVAGWARKDIAWTELREEGKVQKLIASAQAWKKSD